jgi:hypothetical protein
MSSRGKQLSVLIAIVLAGFLPKHVECGYPGGECRRDASFRRVCHAYEVEPVAFYLLERLLERDVGFAYSAGEDCR